MSAFTVPVTTRISLDFPVPGSLREGEVCRERHTLNAQSEHPLWDQKSRKLRAESPLSPSSRKTKTGGQSCIPPPHADTNRGCAPAVSPVTLSVKGNKGPCHPTKSAPRTRRPLPRRCQHPEPSMMVPHLYQLRGDTRQASPQRGAAQRPEPPRATLPPGHVLSLAARSGAGPESPGA